MSFSSIIFGLGAWKASERNTLPNKIITVTKTNAQYTSEFKAQFETEALHVSESGQLQVLNHSLDLQNVMRASFRKYTFESWTCYTHSCLFLKMENM